MTRHLTIQVQNYRLVYPGGQSQFILQSPITGNPRDDHLIPVRQDGGATKNEVSFKSLEQLARVDDATHSAPVHGILITSSEEKGYRKGDQVWLYESPLRIAKTRKNQETIKVVNLRTWTCLTVILTEVFWVPTYRKLDRGQEEELLTLSGPPVRRLLDKAYILAVVQRIHRGSNNNNNSNVIINGFTTVAPATTTTTTTTTETVEVEVKEILERETFGYQNLRRLPDGERITEEFSLRILAITAPEFFSGLPPQGFGPDPTAGAVTAPEWEVGVASTVFTPPWGHYNNNIDPSTGIDGNANYETCLESNEADILYPFERPQQMCNLPCDVFPAMFNQSEYVSPFPTEVHCIDEGVPQGSDCIINNHTTPHHHHHPQNIQWCCTRTTADFPGYKKTDMMTAMIMTSLGEGSIQESSNSSNSSIESIESSSNNNFSNFDFKNEEYANFSINPVVPMEFDPNLTAVEEMGRMDFGIGMREDLVDDDGWRFTRDRVNWYSGSGGE